jgi:membrane protein YdbS with pleckstrin-like domain
VLGDRHVAVVLEVGELDATPGPPPAQDAYGQAAHAAQPTYAASPPPAVPMQAMPDVPRILFDGSPSWRASFWHFVFAWFLILGGIGAGAVLFAILGPLGIVGAGIALVGIVWLVIARIAVRSKHVRITTHTIDLETGVFGKTIHTLQLWRVHDIDYEQSFGERLLGIARINVLSQDQEQPRVTLAGLDGSRELFNNLKEAIAIARQSRNVLGVVN